MDVTPKRRGKCFKVLRDIHGIVTKWSKRSSTHFYEIPKDLLMTTVEWSVCSNNRASILADFS